MKQFLAVILCLPLTLAGCVQPTAPTPPLAPGYSNQADQVMGEVLAAAHSFYQTLQADSVTGKFSPSPTEKTALNTFALTLNSAQTVYLAYHSGTATQAQAQAAVTAVQTQQTQLQTQLAAGVK